MKVLKSLRSVSAGGAFETFWCSCVLLSLVSGAVGRSVLEDSLELKSPRLSWSLANATRVSLPIQTRRQSSFKGVELCSQLPPVQDNRSPAAVGLEEQPR